MIEKPLAFANLFKILEKAVGQRTKYTILQPFPCVTFAEGQPAIIPIQHAGRTIATHVGLTNLTFVIAVTAQSPTTAGHIELAPSRDGFVDVEVSRDICEYKDAVLATLCHEVSHKFLHVHGIRSGTLQVEQEYLTDVAAVYLGMGKIMLNGCECQGSSSRTVGGSTTTTTTTLRTGYISRECFAFVYRLICEMRNIPPEQFLWGLSGPAREALARVEHTYGSWFKQDYHTPEGIDAVAEDLRTEILDSQTRTAKLDRAARRLEIALGTLQISLRQSHKLLSQAQMQVAGLVESDPNPHLRYLGCIEARESVGTLVNESRKQIMAHRPDWDRIESVARNLRPTGPDDSPVVVECPIDRTKLRVPGGKTSLLVTCASCRYKFIVNTGHNDTEPPANMNRPGDRGRQQVRGTRWRALRHSKIARLVLVGAALLLIAVGIAALSVGGWPWLSSSATTADGQRPDSAIAENEPPTGFTESVAADVASNQSVARKEDVFDQVARDQKREAELTAQKHARPATRPQQVAPLPRFQEEYTGADRDPEIVITNRADRELTVTLDGVAYPVPTGNPFTGGTVTITHAAGTAHFHASAAGAIPIDGWKEWKRGYKYTWTFWIERKLAP